MIRLIAILAFVLAGLGAPLAQEAPPPTTPPAAPAPSTEAAPAAPDIQVDPSATIDNTPKQLKLLTGIYATQAVIDICSITVPEDVATAMSNDRKRYEGLLIMDEAASTRAYEATKAEVQSTAPDCAEGSTDRQGVDAVLAAYTTR
jgi:hypothetical protein